MIETARLVLIPMTHSFISLLIANHPTAYSELDVQPNTEWPSTDIKEILPFLLKSLSPNTTPDGFGAWLFVDKSNRTIVGDGGFKGAPINEGAVDIGYNIIPSKRRIGYAYEATSALITWALSQEDVKMVTADCLIENTPSINLLKKLNMVEVGSDTQAVYFRNL